MRRVWAWLCSVGVAGFGVSCGPTVVYEAEQELPGIWTYADSISFSYEIADTSRAYDLTLTLGHTTSFASENLYTKFITVYPDGARQPELVSLVVADRFGQWLGNCGAAACEIAIPLQDSARFPVPGRYGLVLQQYMRQDSIVGPTRVGLRVTEAE